MSEHCCKHEAVEIDYKHPNAKAVHALKEAKKIRAETAAVAYEETSHPAFPHKGDINKCPVMGGKGTKGIDWHAKYMQSQRDLVEEAGRWGKRLQDLELAYAEKIMRIQQEYESTMENGFQEAYDIIMAERNKCEQMQKEYEATMQEGYSQAYEIIEQLKKSNETLANDLGDNQ